MTTSWQAAWSHEQPNLAHAAGLVAVDLIPVDLEAPGKVRGALYHYNPVETYVDAVVTYAAAIRRDPRLYYAM